MINIIITYPQIKRIDLPTPQYIVPFGRVFTSHIFRESINTNVSFLFFIVLKSISLNIEWSVKMAMAFVPSTASPKVLQILKSSISLQSDWIHLVLRKMISFSNC